MTKLVYDRPLLKYLDNKLRELRRLEKQLNETSQTDPAWYRQKHRTVEYDALLKLLGALDGVMRTTAALVPCKSRRVL